MSNGAVRYDNARRAGVTDRAINLPGKNARDADRLAALAETYFASRYGLEDQIQHGYKSCDIVVGTAHLDVKWTPHHGGHLILQDPKRLGSKRHICTAYVLVTGPEGDMCISGWEWGFKVVAPGYARWLEYPAWSVKNEDLRRNVDILMAATFRTAVKRPEFRLQVE